MQQDDRGQRFTAVEEIRRAEDCGNTSRNKIQRTFKADCGVDCDVVQLIDESLKETVRRLNRIKAMKKKKERGQRKVVQILDV